MSDTCHDCGADSGTVGVVEVCGYPRLCPSCLQREGFGLHNPDAPSPVKLHRRSRPTLPLRADKWEIDYESEHKREPTGEGWWLIDTHAIVHPETEDSRSCLQLVRVYARRRDPK